MLRLTKFDTNERHWLMKDCCTAITNRTLCTHIVPMRCAQHHPVTHRKYRKYHCIYCCSSVHFFCHVLTVAGLGLFRAVCYVSAPVAIVKSLISLLHGYVACKNLGVVDVKEREALRSKSQ